MIALDAELRATTIADPDLVAVVAPRPFEHAIGAAELTAQPHFAMRTDAATMRPAAIRLADERFPTIALALTLAAAELKLGAATVVDPDAAVVVAPVASFDAVGAAELADEVNAVGGVRAAELAVSITRFARDGSVFARDERSNDAAEEKGGEND